MELLSLLSPPFSHTREAAVQHRPLLTKVSTRGFGTWERGSPIILLLPAYCISAPSHRWQQEKNNEKKLSAEKRGTPQAIPFPFSDGCGRRPEVADLFDHQSCRWGEKKYSVHFYCCSTTAHLLVGHLRRTASLVQVVQPTPRACRVLLGCKIKYLTSCHGPFSEQGFDESHPKSLVLFLFA